MVIKGDTKKVRAGLLVKLSGTAAVFLLIAISVFSITSVLSLEHSSLETAILMGNSKLKGDMVHFAYMINQNYGSLSLKNGELVSEEGSPLTYQYGVVDTVSSDLGIAATVFVRDNNDYRRISTSIVDGSGKTGGRYLFGIRQRRVWTRKFRDNIHRGSGYSWQELSYRVSADFFGEQP